MRPVESWLKSENPDRFAAAAIRCQHGGAYCMSDGFCHFNGECFRSDAYARRVGAAAIERAASEQPHDVASQMKLAASWLRTQPD